MYHRDMLILASQSPRRKEILAQAGLSFLAVPAQVEEQPLPGEDVCAYVRRLARAKAEAVRGAPDDIVLGADTVVVIDNQILGKPSSAADAAQMLKRLSGRQHLVVTGICLKASVGAVVDEETTRVRFVPLSDREIEDYVSSGEPMDKAGAYAIQGRASRFIDRIEGCYFNVVGLPIALVYKHLKRITARHGRNRTAERAARAGRAAVPGEIDD